MTKKGEIKHIARCLFEIEISLGQLSAYEEGMDKLLGLPMRSKWKNMGTTQKWWIKRAKKYIEERGIKL